MAKAGFDKRSHDHDKRTSDRHGPACECDEKNLEHDESKKIHLCDEMVGHEITENDR